MLFFFPAEPLLIVDSTVGLHSSKYHNIKGISFPGMPTATHHTTAQLLAMQLVPAGSHILSILHIKREGNELL